MKITQLGNFPAAIGLNASRIWLRKIKKTKGNKENAVMWFYAIFSRLKSSECQRFKVKNQWNVLKFCNRNFISTKIYQSYDFNLIVIRTGVGKIVPCISIISTVSVFKIDDKGTRFVLYQSSLLKWYKTMYWSLFPVPKPTPCQLPSRTPAVLATSLAPMERLRPRRRVRFFTGHFGQIYNRKRATKCDAQQIPSILFFICIY